MRATRDPETVLLPTEFVARAELRAAGRGADASVGLRTAPQPVEHDPQQVAGARLPLLLGQP